MREEGGMERMLGAEHEEPDELNTIRMYLEAMVASFHWATNISEDPLYPKHLCPEHCGPPPSCPWFLLRLSIHPSEGRQLTAETLFPAIALG